MGRLPQVGIHHDRRPTKLASFEAIVRALDEANVRSLSPLYGDIDVRFVSLPTLIDMNKAAGRLRT
jgi:hypothetical protein